MALIMRREGESQGLHPARLRIKSHCRNTKEQWDFLGRVGYIITPFVQPLIATLSLSLSTKHPVLPYLDPLLSKQDCKRILIGGHKSGS